MSAWELVHWNGETAQARPDVARLVRAFVSLPTPMGAEAAAWLSETALPNDGSTRTHLLLGRERVEGYFALCSAEVRVRSADVKRLGLPRSRTTLPATLVAWLAKHRDTDVAGEEILGSAYAVARRAARDVGAAVLALDAGDEAVARVWRSAPYGFRSSAGSDERLWLPMNPAA